MEFLKHFKDQNIVTEAYEEVAAESWKSILVNMFGDSRSYERDLNKLMSNQKLTSYIAKECDKIFESVKEKDPSVTKTLPSGWWKSIKLEFKKKDADNESKISNADALSSFRKDIDEKSMFSDKVNGYYVTIFYDDKSISMMRVLLYSEDRDMYVVRTIPTPDASMFKFKEEKKSSGLNININHNK